MDSNPKETAIKWKMILEDYKREYGKFPQYASIPKETKHLLKEAGLLTIVEREHPDDPDQKEVLCLENPISGEPINFFKTQEGDEFYSRAGPKPSNTHPALLFRDTWFGLVYGKESIYNLSPNISPSVLHQGLNI